MASNESNALAELAERLDKGRWNLDVNDYNKAIRIIAELAKADATYEADMAHNNICLLAYDAFEKCREIAAEEGENE